MSDYNVVGKSSRRGAPGRPQGEDQQPRSLYEALLAPEFVGPIAGVSGAQLASGVFSTDKDVNIEYPGDWRELRDEFLVRGYKDTLPGLATEYYTSDHDRGYRLKPWDDAATNWIGTPGMPPNYEKKGQDAFIQGLRPTESSKRDYEQALPRGKSRLKDRLPDEVPLARPDWDAFHRTSSLSPDATRELVEKYRLGLKENVPVYPRDAGPDLGSFHRRSRPDSSEHMARVFTVTPEVNASRFAHRFLPDVVEDVYRSIKDQPETKAVLQDALQPWVPELGRINTPSNTGPTALGPSDRPSGPDLTELRGWRQKGFEEKVKLMDQMAPGQSRGGGVSATVWGTVGPTPRYEYSEIRKGTIKGQNPEVHILDVETPMHLQTNYALTEYMRSPFVRRGGSSSHDVGPHWGATEGTNAIHNTARRGKKDTRGDIMFNAGLIERRGALSLADVQALQRKYGIPVTKDAGYRGDGFRDAVESLRVKLGLGSHAEVVERFARSMPRLGSTTAPREPYREAVSILEVGPDVSRGAPSSFQRAYDLPAALERAGFPATLGGVRGVNNQVRQGASREFSKVTRMAGALAPTGFVGGMLLDPEGAKLFGQGLKQGGEEGARKAFKGATTMLTNSGIGAAAGTALQQGVKTFARRSPALAAQVLPRVAQASAGLTPYGLALAAYQTADAAVEGYTGRPIVRHAADRFRQSPAGQALRTAVGGRQAAEILPQVFPPRPTAAVTSRTGTVTQARSSRVGDRGAQGRVYAGQGYGWQSQQSYQKLQREGRLPGNRLQQLAGRAYTAVDRLAGGLLPGGATK